MPTLPGVMHAAEVGDERASPESELMHVGFADQYRARRLQSADHFRIFGGNAIFEDAASCGRSHSRRIEEVLQRDGNPMQWAAPFSTLNLGFGRPGVLCR